MSQMSPGVVRKVGKYVGYIPSNLGGLSWDYTNVNFVDATSPSSHFLPFGTSDKVQPLLLNLLVVALYAYTVQPCVMCNIDPTSGLSFIWHQHVHCECGPGGRS
jgi:hypothetical protein